MGQPNQHFSEALLGVTIFSTPLVNLKQHPNGNHGAEKPRDLKTEDSPSCSF
jgi:hypothetical protein